MESDKYVDEDDEEGDNGDDELGENIGSAVRLDVDEVDEYVHDYEPVDGTLNVYYDKRNDTFKGENSHDEAGHR